MNHQSKKNKIIKDTETRLRTVMIGSLSRVEEVFGYLWNHGSDPTTKNQELFADKWEDLRQSILNHGNKQIRETVEDLQKFFYLEEKYPYNYNFTFNKNRREK
jgi:hypothetical protein